MYQIIKGWPSRGAIDEIVKPATLDSIAAGTVGLINSDGEGESATCDSAGANANLLSFFCIDVDEVTGNVTGLIDKCLIEVDSDHYVSGTYAPGDEVTATGGLFDVIDTSTKPVGKVRSFDGTTGKMKVLFYGE